MKLQSIQPAQMQDLHLLFLWMIMYSSHKMIWPSHMRDEKNSYLEDNLGLAYYPISPHQRMLCR